MKINWKVRAKNPQWWLSVALAVVVPIGAYYGLTGSDVTSWGVFFDTLNGFLGQLLIGLRKGNSRKTKKQSYNYSYHGSGLFIVNELIQWICVKSKQFGRQITLSRIR